jgi:hypothetical protein
MDVEDLVTSEVVVAVAATAAVLSSRVRKVARRGIVYGVAGALSAGDMLSSFGKGMAGGIQNAAGAVQQHVDGNTEDNTSQPAEG